MDVNELADKVVGLNPADVRAAQVERLMECLDEADALQQALLGDSHPVACYEFHDSITNISDELAGFLGD